MVLKTFRRIIMPPANKSSSGKAGQDNVFSKFFETAPLMAGGQETYARNVESLRALNKLMVESFQTISKRQQEITQDLFEDYTGAVRSLLGAHTPEQRANKQVDVLKNAFEKSIANAGELAEIYAKSSREAIEIFTRRTTDMLEEAKKI
jgi:phasin family protein